MMSPVREAALNDAAQIAEIYNEYVKKSVYTFEEIPVSPEIMENRIGEGTGRFPWLVFQGNEQILGYAYIGPYKSRCAYRLTAEVSIYVRQGHHSQGIGTRLYQELFPVAEKTPIHSIVAGIALPNPASVRLHEKFGFLKTAHFREIGFKFNRWIDVGYWQKIMVHSGSSGSAGGSGIE